MAGWIWIFYGWFEDKKFVPRDLRDTKYRHATLILYCLSCFIFFYSLEDVVQPRLVPLTIFISRGELFPLMSFFLGQLYKELDMLSEGKRNGGSHFSLEYFISTIFLQVFLWERFPNYAPTSCSLEAIRSSQFNTSNLSSRFMRVKLFVVVGFLLIQWSIDI